MPLEQSGVQIFLRVEVVVDDRRRDPGAPSDLSDRRRLITALCEDLRRRALDQVPSVGFR
jgi:hypothetical protein